MIDAEMTKDSLPATHDVVVTDQNNTKRNVAIPGESPLTIKVDGREIVTIMTLGTNPRELVLGFIRTQGLIEDIADVKSVDINWDTETANIRIKPGKGLNGISERLSKRTVTSGCGGGTLFAQNMDELYELNLPAMEIRQSTIYTLLKQLKNFNLIYRQAGSVHGCGLCSTADILFFYEDVGRHNAADTIAGRMWLDGISGADKILYTTGRLTSEIVIKAAMMGIPALLSRSGVTKMGLELSQDLGITLIARARAKKFYIYNGAENVIFDETQP
ncbi:MAG: formate dehydrogenase accessory sulfurtransferase FdhD [Desulfobacteraceae bacterium]|jgi:FdhD protein|nr:formate dehydrogenase accessory sulfurtransferase FdhD [Desulfobacteraceae bacterium]